MDKFKQVATSILSQLYMEKYETDEFDYDTVDEFYAYLGYDLSLIDELQKLGIESTSELQDAMLSI